MACLSVSDQVNHDVMEERLSVFCGSFESKAHLLEIVSIDVDDWGIDRLGQV